MPRPVVLDVSVLHAWSLRGLLLGLADRDPPVLVPRWCATALPELRASIEALLAPRRGPAQAAHDARAIVERVSACYPEAEVPAADPVDAAVLARAEAIVTADPAALAASGAGRFGIAVLDPDELLVGLHADDPWRMLHATMLYAFVLRRPGRGADDLIAELARSVPDFAHLVRRQIAGLPANQPPEFFPAAPGDPAPGEEAVEGWCCVACDPFPCPGHRAPLMRIWGVRASCLHDDECRFVGVSQTAQHRTLVWPAADDPRMLEIAAAMRHECRNPRLVPYRRGFGPAVSYWEWEATGSRVHGVHDIPPPAL